VCDWLQRARLAAQVMHAEGPSTAYQAGRDALVMMLGK